MNKAERKKEILKLKVRALRNTARAAKILVVMMDGSRPDPHRLKALHLFMRMTLQVRMSLLHASTISSQPLKPFAKGGVVVGPCPPMIGPCRINEILINRGE